MGKKMSWFSVLKRLFIPGDKLKDIKVNSTLILVLVFFGGKNLTILCVSENKEFGMDFQELKVETMPFN